MDRYRAEWEGDAGWAYGLIEGQVPADQRPAWAVGIVLAAVAVSGRTDCLPEDFADLQVVALDAQRWAEAREIFGRIRGSSLQAGGGADPLCRAVVRMTESAAKVTFNASGGGAPYDASSGAVLIRLAGKVANTLGSAAATDVLWRAINVEQPW